MDTSSVFDISSTTGKACSKAKKHGFHAFGLHKAVLKGIAKRGYRHPTPIQRAVIPSILRGEDVVAMARTGSGKTAAFLIPLLHQLVVPSDTTTSAVVSSARSTVQKVIVLSPTRELAQQTYREAVALSKFTSLKTVLLVGGEALEHQFSELELSTLAAAEAAHNAGPDILVGTPGRILHLLLETPLPQLFKRATKVSVVLDEADRLFEMGFRTEIETILQRLHVAGRRQILLFSATLPAQLADFAKVGLHAPHVIRLDVESKLSAQLALDFFLVRPEERDAALLFLLNYFISSPLSVSASSSHLANTTHSDDNNNNSTRTMSANTMRESLDGNVKGTKETNNVRELTLIFCASRHHVEYLQALLSLVGWEVCALYGRMDQAARNIALAKFRRGLTRVMIVTDVAARGIDIPQIDTVINYDFPPTPKIFVHRVGRTARLSNNGRALTLVTPQDWALLAHTESSVLRATRILTDFPLLSQTPSASHGDAASSSGSTSRLPAYYGHIPAHLLELELERVTALRTQRADLAALHRSMTNAYKVYYQTRPSPPARAVERGKTLDHSRIHPLLLSFVDSLEIERTKYVEQLRHFRPRETVFEVESKLCGQRNEIMHRKRLLHETLILKHHRRRQKETTKEILSADSTLSGHSDISETNREPSSSASSSVVQEKNATLCCKRKYDVVNTAHENEDDSVVSDSDECTELRRAKRPHHDSTGASAYRDVTFWLNDTPKDYESEAALAIRERQKHNAEEHTDVANLVLDLVPDDERAILQKRRIQKWDRKRKKFVQLNAGVDTLSRYIRNEAGKRIKLDETRKENGVTAKKFKEWLEHQGQQFHTVSSDMADATPNDRSNAATKISKSEGGQSSSLRERQRQQWLQSTKSKLATPSQCHTKTELKTPDQIRKARQKKTVHAKRRRLNQRRLKNQYKSLPSRSKILLQ
jgi:ATP-dependent RNA helicase DDX54/DBP10